MISRLSVSERRFNSWLRGRQGQQGDFGEVIDGIWQLLRGANCESDQEHGYFCLLYFILCKRKKQNSMIRRVCAIFRVTFWSTLVYRSGSLYCRMSSHVHQLEQKKALMGSEDFQRYLYKALEYTLLECNQECLLDLADVRRNFFDPEELEDYYRQYGGLVGVVDDPRGDQPLNVIMNKLDLRQQAENLSLDLLEDWSMSQLNVLCHYYETFMGIRSGRLSGESRSNVDQLHSRIRKKFIGYLNNKDYDRDVARVFFEVEIKKICQQCPAQPVYRIRNGVTHDTPV
jgi:hypothetical protein